MLLLAYVIYVCFQFDFDEGYTGTGLLRWGASADRVQAVAGDLETSVRV